MKYRLSTLLLLFALVAVAVGWIAERRHYKTRIEKEVAREGEVRSAYSMAQYTNNIYKEMDSLSEKEFSKRRDGQLLTNVLHLYINEAHVAPRWIPAGASSAATLHQQVGPGAKDVLNESCESLTLLGIDSSEGFHEALSKSFAGKFVDEFCNGDSLEDELADFITRSLATKNES